MPFATQHMQRLKDAKTNQFVAAALLALTATAAFCGSDYKAGSGDSVRDWRALDYEQIKTQTAPIIIYIANEAYKNNQFAKFLENDVLGSTEVRDKLQTCVKVRLNSDGKSGKGWSRDIFNRGINGAAILLVSSDLRYILGIDKSTPKEQLNAKYLLQQINLMANYQTRIKKSEENQKKGESKELAAKPPEEKSKDLLGGILGEKERTALDGKKDATHVKIEETKKKAAEPIDE